MSFDKDKENGSAGVVMRDHAGVIIAASCLNLHRCGGALEAEFLAIKEGSLLAF